MGGRTLGDRRMGGPLRAAGQFPRRRARCLCPRYVGHPYPWHRRVHGSCPCCVCCPRGCHVDRQSRSRHLAACRCRLRQLGGCPCRPRRRGGCPCRPRRRAGCRSPWRRRASGPCRWCRRCRGGPVTCLAGPLRRCRPARPVRSWRCQSLARASGLRGGPSIRHPAARARSRPPPTPTLRAVVPAATPPECQIHRKRIEGRYQHGSDPQREDVRRRPTLPRGPPRSTIGAEGLNFRVRNGTGCFPFAMATETLWRCQALR
jgi:hypothetical protein